MNELDALTSLAELLGVHTRYIDGLGRPVTAGPDTLVRVCAALGAPIERPADAAEALRACRDAAEQKGLAPVLVAWDGRLPPTPVPGTGSLEAELRLEDGEVVPLEIRGSEIRASGPLPLGYHHLRVDSRNGTQSSTVIPNSVWRAISM